jgi:hypothetical protein
MESDMQPNNTPTSPRVIDIVQTDPADAKKRRMITLGIILVVIIAAGTAYWFYRKNQTTHFTDLTPAEQLQTLKESSQSVSSTPDERTENLENLEKSSQPVKASEQERLNQLDALQ